MTVTSDMLLDAALEHVPFDGWSEAAFRAAINDTGADAALARAYFPRGGLDMALAFHRRGDELMLERLARHDLASMRMRERVSLAIRARLEGADREIVRRGAVLFSLPQHAADGVRAIWNTADAIWNALGDNSEDGNWYTKRAILSGVYSSTLLYWLGDDSPGHADSWAFLDRRIDEVMRFEQAKAQVQKSPFLRTVFALPLAVMGAIHKPAATGGTLPGRWHPAKQAE
ncbi:MAG: COQ9 family protein [Pararhodobacter sp.]|nr:COQ9 family protein [Pararhodobacter sp.]